MARDIPYSELEEITLTDDVTDFSRYPFESLANLTILISKAATPPTLSESSFTDTQYKNLDVRVPAASLQAYKRADVWKKFSCLSDGTLTISLNYSRLNLEVGNTRRLTATILPVSNNKDKTVTWTSSNNSVATVLSDGTVSAVGAGTAVITARCGSAAATCNVTVTNVYTYFSADPGKLYTLGTARGYLPQGEELTQYKNSSCLFSTNEIGVAGRFRITGSNGSYQIYNVKLKKYLSANGTLQTPYVDISDGTFAIYRADAEGGNASKWIIKSNATGKWMMISNSYYNNCDTWKILDDGDQWTIDEIEPTYFTPDPNKIYTLGTARGYLPKGDETTTLWEKEYIISTEDEAEAGRFRITGSYGEYQLLNTNLNKYLSTDGTPQTPYVGEADGTFSIVAADELGGDAGKWIIKSNVTGNWMMFGGQNQFLNNDGWKTADDGDQWIIEELKPTYTLTFKVDDEVIKTESLKEGAAIVCPDVPEKEGYTLSGWSEHPETMPAHDVTITGSYTVNSYDVVYMVLGEEWQRQTYQYGATITAPEAPVVEGYTFVGWDGLPESMPAHDVTITGSYTVNSYDVIYVVLDEEWLRQTYQYGATIPAPGFEPVVEGYTFVGWDGRPETMPAHDVTVNAVMEKLFTPDPDKCYTLGTPRAATCPRALP